MPFPHAKADNPWTLGCGCKCDDCSCKSAPEIGETKKTGGDPGWFQVHAELADLHVEKSNGYGTPDEPLANYITTSQAVGEPDEFACWFRIHEKTIRAINLIRAGRANENLEGVDVAALALAAEALRRRRL